MVEEEEEDMFVLMERGQYVLMELLLSGSIVQTDPSLRTALMGTHPPRSEDTEDFMVTTGVLMVTRLSALTSPLLSLVTSSLIKLLSCLYPQVTGVFPPVLILNLPRPVQMAALPPS